MSLSAQPPGSTLVLASSTPLLPSETNRVAIVLSLSASFPWPARLPPRSVPTSRCAAARTLLHSPPAGVVKRAISRPPLPPLPSSHSSPPPRQAPTPIRLRPLPPRKTPQ